MLIRKKVIPILSGLVIMGFSIIYIYQNVNTQTKASDGSSVTSIKDDVDIEPIHVKDMKSLEDITEDMIIKRTVGYNTKNYSSSYSDYNFEISVGTFSGCDFSKIIRTEQESKVTIHYSTTMKKDSMRLDLIFDDNIITIPKDQNEFTYTLPKGDTIIAFTGYKASGKIEMSLDTSDGAKFIQNTDYD